MKQLTSHDLQIGDLVLAKTPVSQNQPLYIIEIHKQTVFLADQPDETDVRKLTYKPIDEIKPIELSEQFLLNNGFVKNENTCGFELKISNILIEIFDSLNPSNSRPYTVSVCEVGEWKINRCYLDPMCCADINYVHELQHLINLCNVKLLFHVKDK